MQVVRVLNEIEKPGFHVTAAVARGSGSYESRLRRDIPLVSCQTRFTSSLLSVSGSVLALGRAIDDFAADVVCSVQEHANVALLAAARVSRRRPGVVLGIQNNFSARAKSEPLWARMLLHPAYLRAYANADHVIANSRGVADDIVHRVPSLREKISVVYNAGVDDKLLALAAEPLDCDRASGPVIVTCGRLTEQKDQGTLLRAFALIDSQPAPELWILGEGEELPALEALARELGVSSRVRFLGFRSNPYPFLAAADVFALSSRWEGFGNVVVEALACGTPVVSTDCPHGPREILEGGRYGRLVPVGDPRALGEALREALLERETTNRQELRARASVFSARESAAGYAAVLSAVARSRASSRSDHSPNHAASSRPSDLL